MNCSDWQEQILDYMDDELTPESEDLLERHVGTCPDCRRLLDEMHEQQQAFSALRKTPVPEATITRVQTALRDETRTGAASEILTLEDVAAFLKIPEDALNEIAEELPLFELAGHVRIRKKALMDWVDGRERDYTRRRLQRELTEQVSTFTAGVA